jgi:hypothetical protein
MKITSRLLLRSAVHMKKKGVTQAAITLASLYGVNEVFGTLFTARLILPQVIHAVQSAIRRMFANGKRKTSNAASTSAGRATK